MDLFVSLGERNMTVCLGRKNRGCVKRHTLYSYRVMSDYF